MQTHNVVPIDEAAARSLARRRRRFHLFVAAMTLLWLSVLVPSLVFTPLPPLLPFALLAVLVVLAEHRFVLFGDETSMSGSLIALCSAGTLFAARGALVGPLLVGACGGLYLAHLRRRAFSKALVNAATMSLSAGACALVMHCARLVVPGPNALRLLVPIVGVSTYWLINNSFVSAYLAVNGQTDLRRGFIALVRSDTAVVWWGLAAVSGIAMIGPHLGVRIFLVAVLVVGFSVDTVPNRARPGATRAHAIRSGELTALAVWTGVAAALLSQRPHSAYEVATLLALFFFATRVARPAQGPLGVLPAAVVGFAVSASVASPVLLTALLAGTLASQRFESRRYITTVALLVAAASAASLLSQRAGGTLDVALIRAATAALVPLALLAIRAWRTSRPRSIPHAVGLLWLTPIEVLLVALAAFVALATDTSGGAGMLALPAWMILAMHIHPRVPSTPSERGRSLLGERAETLL